MGRSSMVPTHFVLDLFLESRTQGQKTNSESKLNFPLVKTSAYQYALYPHAISLWYSLPEDIHSCHTIMAFLSVT